MSGLGIGLARCAWPSQGFGAPPILDVLYTVLRWGEDAFSDRVAEAAGLPGENTTVQIDPHRLLSTIGEGHPDEARALQRLAKLNTLAPHNRALRPVVTIIRDGKQAPASVADAFLRLQLLSARRIKPWGISLDGIFGLLPTMVWTAEGPFTPEEFDDLRLKTLAECGSLPEVRALDKIPRMVDYVIPPGVRIADPSRVRLGAYLGDGTTVMHEGFVNFNAGTLGKAMVEGRISQGVVVGDGSDIGGGASIMGTLSGGGKEVVSIGQQCLVGANAGLGISLGDRCTVEAGTYVTAGSKVRLPDGQMVKALQLSGQSDMLLWRNSQSGALEAHPKSNAVKLNPVLHG